FGAPSLGTVATKGEGVFEGLERIARLVLKSYEKDPKVQIGPSESGEEGPTIEEDGIARALRGMEAAGVEAPTKISQVLPEYVSARRPSAEALGIAPGASAPAPAASVGGSGGLVASPTQGSASVAPAEAPVSSSAGHVGGAFSLAELWPEADRDGVRQAEAMLGARDAVHAILACDVLVTRVLASAAGLVGTLDA